MYRHAFLAASAALAIIVSGGAAQASCFAAARAPAIRLPPLPALPAAAPTAAPSIVGMWQVVHSANGQVVNQAFEQWHSDGTEFEFADFAPATGDICMGTWSKTSTGGIKLYHTGWTFDATGKPTGTMLFTATYALNAPGTGFKGPFDLKFYDPAGKLLVDVKGQTAGTKLP